MKKSYTTLIDCTLDLYSGITKFIADGVSVDLDEDYGSDLVDAGILVANTDWTKPVNALSLASTAGDTAYDFDMDGFTGEKLLKIDATTTGEDLPTGSTIVIKVQNAAGTTDYETITLAVGAITAAATTTFYIKPQALLKTLGTRLNFSGTIKDPASGTGITTITVTLIDEVVADAVIWTIGAEGSDKINVGMQLLDSAGDALVNSAGIVEFYISSDNRGIVPVATSDSLAIGTAGDILAVLEAKQTLLLVSELDGTVDVDVEEATGGPTVYAVVKFDDGRKVVSPPITFTA